MANPTPLNNPEDHAPAGHEHYTPGFLKIYDLLVLGFYGNVVWRCPTRRLVEHYDRHVRRRHLDVGPGTGYFLERARLPADARIALLDPNPDVLAHASRRLARLAPSVIEADVCTPITRPLMGPLTDERRFDSAALNYVLHCLPGPMARKAAAVRNVAAVLMPDGVLFGATVLGTPPLHTWLSRAVLGYVNRKGIFDNLSDTEAGLRDILSDAFEVVDLQVVGSVAVFSAATPRHLPS